MALRYYERNEQAIKEDFERTAFGDGPPVMFIKPGKTLVRILPAYANHGRWYRKSYEHKLNLDGKYRTVPSAFGTGKPDPFHEISQQLYETNQVDLAKSLRPQEVYYYNVVCFSSPDGNSDLSVRVLRVGKKLHRQIQAIDLDYSSGYGDITNPEKGFNIFIERSGRDLNTEYTARAVRQQSNLFQEVQARGGDPASLELYDLDKYFLTPSYEELKALAERVVDSGNRRSDDSTAPVSSVPVKTLAAEEGLTGADLPSAQGGHGRAELINKASFPSSSLPISTAENGELPSDILQRRREDSPAPASYEKLSRKITVPLIPPKPQTNK